MEPGNGGETISPPFRPDGNEEDDSSPVLYPQNKFKSRFSNHRNPVTLSEYIKRMKWYADYLSIYDKPFTQAPQAVINQVKDKIRQLATHAPLVSVVAIAHNEEKRILSCLWSLCENQHNYPVEILVINNHSTDHTEEVLKELGVTYFNEYQKGPGFARQCGLNHARGSIISA